MGADKREMLRAAAERVAKEWREKARLSREEADRIRRTVKAATDAEERCYVRAEVWDKCVADLLAALSPEVPHA